MVKLSSLRLLFTWYVCCVDGLRVTLAPKLADAMLFSESQMDPKAVWLRLTCNSIVWLGTEAMVIGMRRYDASTFKISTPSGAAHVSRVSSPRVYRRAREPFIASIV